MKRMLFSMMISICFIAPTRAQSSADPAELPSESSPAHLLQSIQRELKDPRYAKEVLPNNFSYLMQLLEFGVQTNQPREYTQNVLSLFSKLLKGTEYVNSYVFCSLIEQMPRLLQKNFMYYQPGSPTQQMALNDLDILDRLQQTISTTMYSKFTQEFASFKQNPDNFLQELTQKITESAEKEMSIESLRHTLVRFLEVGLSKLIWHANDQTKTWDCVKRLSDSVALLMEANIIDDVNDLDELFWTLTHRYCYFLDLHTTQLSLSFYEQVKHDLATQQLTLFGVDEQESFIQSKAECLTQTVLTQEAKKRAFDYQPNTPLA